VARQFEMLCTKKETFLCSTEGCTFSIQFEHPDQLEMLDHAVRSSLASFIMHIRVPPLHVVQSLTSYSAVLRLPLVHVQCAFGSGIDRAAHRVQKAEQRAYCAPTAPPFYDSVELRI